MIKFICFLIKACGFQIDWFEIIFVVSDIVGVKSPHPTQLFGNFL